MSYSNNYIEQLDEIKDYILSQLREHKRDVRFRGYAYDTIRNNTFYSVEQPFSDTEGDYFVIFPPSALSFQSRPADASYSNFLGEATFSFFLRAPQDESLFNRFEMNWIGYLTGLFNNEGSQNYQLVQVLSTAASTDEKGMTTRKPSSGICVITFVLEILFEFQKLDPSCFELCIC
jgi:hypothetical protein